MLIMITTCGYNGQPENGSDDDADTSANITDIGRTMLVIYSTLAPYVASPIITTFQERYNITVAIHTATTAQTLSRLRDEAISPQADILWGASVQAVTPYLHLLEDFTSANEPYMIPGHENTTGRVTSFTANAGLLIVNTYLIGDIEIRGYKCLLNPALSGQIAFAYPTAASLPFNHLINQLFAMGSGGLNSGWDYIQQFISNTDGIIKSDFTAVHNGVIDGDFIVGLTCEETFFRHMAADAPVHAVYMDEGIMPAPMVVSIVNGTINRDGAEAFINFVTSHEVQAFLELNLRRRAVRSDVQPLGIPVGNADINWLPANTEYILTYRDMWIEQFWDMWMAQH